MPAYNEERWIAEALDSLSRQTLTGFELIVVDDGSTDSTGRIAREHGARVIRTANRGSGAARDVGGRAATGEILVFVDADEVYTPDYLCAMVAPLADPDVRGTMPGKLRWHNPHDGLASGWLRVHGFENGREIRRRGTYPYPKALRRADLLRVGGYPHARRGEGFLLGRLLGPAVVVPEAEYRFSLPTGTWEAFDKSRSVGRGPLFEEQRPPLSTMLPPRSWWTAARFAARRDAKAAWVQLLWDAGLTIGLVESRLRPSLREERRRARKITAGSAHAPG
jgi:glycosyltransferase involved in cell wall biosynthesis